MLLPSIFGENYFDDFMDDLLKPASNMKFNMGNGLMRTDIKEFENEYEFSIDLPGFKKEDIKINLKNGYLNVFGTKEEESEGFKFLKRERYIGQISRSYYVGSDLKEEDIKARFSDGILYIRIPKEIEKRIEEQKYIAIE